MTDDHKKLAERITGGYTPTPGEYRQYLADRRAHRLKALEMLKPKPRSKKSVSTETP